MFKGKKITIFLYLFSQALFFAPIGYAGDIVETDKESFAQEYQQLGVLLEKVHNKKTAVIYKPQIVNELARIQSSIGKQSDFESLSEVEQKLFIKKFQNNNLHCGYVTKVMDERNRLLLNKETKNELGELLDQLIQ